MTETKTKKPTTAMRARKLEEEMELVKETATTTINELGQLQQALIKIVGDFDERMVAMSSAIATMASILSGPPPQQQQPVAPPPAPRMPENMMASLNVITTDDDEEVLPANLDERGDT